jgi:hypothetical protein
VYAFLNRVADEMIRLHQELANATDDAIRVKTALHQWQVEHAATCTQPPAHDQSPRPPAQQPWTGYGSTSPPSPWSPQPGYPTDPR